MTDLMQCLFTYAQEHLLLKNLDRKEYRLKNCEAELAYERLLQALPEADQDLAEDFKHAEDDIFFMESKALFLSAFQLIRELR